MENAPFADSTIVDSSVAMDAWKYNVTAINSSIGSLTVNLYGNSQPARPHPEHPEQETGQTQMAQGSSTHGRRRDVTFAKEATDRIRNSSVGWSGTSQIPPSISRLRSTRGASAPTQVPGPAYSIGSGYSVAGTTTTAGGSPASYFKATRESRDSLEGHFNLRVKDASIREYMKSGFFVSDTAIPLWNPSPGFTSPKGIEDFNVCVGDVGFFTEGGGFHVLFNAFLSFAGNREMGFDPPQHFEPYGPVHFVEQVSDVASIPYMADYVPFYGDFNPVAIPRHPERTYISSYHLVKQKPKTPRSGAVLDLPNGFWRDQMLQRVVTAMQSYFRLHAENWYNYYFKQPSGRTIPKGHLYIVTGSYKCSAWARAYCSTLSPDEIFARLYKLYPNSDIFYQWDPKGPVVSKCGPDSANFGEDGFPSKNQCVAVEVYSIVKTKGFQKVKKTARASVTKLGSKFASWSISTFTVNKS